MKQNTILPTLILIQKLTFDDSQLNRLKALLGYSDTAWKCTAEAPALYLISAALHEWKSFRHCADAGVQAGLPQLERSTLSKKASHLDFHVIKELFHKTVKQCSRAALDKDPKPAPAGRFNDHDRWKKPVSWRARRHQAAPQLHFTLWNRNAAECGRDDGPQAWWTGWRTADGQAFHLD